MAVGLESMTLDLYEETSVLPALLVASEPNDPDLGPQQSCSYLCLSSDNRYDVRRCPDTLPLHCSSSALFHADKTGGARTGAVESASPVAASKEVGSKRVMHQQYFRV